MSLSPTRWRLWPLAVIAAVGCASSRTRQAPPKAPVPGPSAPGASAPVPTPLAPSEPQPSVLGPGIFAPAGPGATATAPAPGPVREELDVVFGKGGNEDLRLDLYTNTKETGPMPAMVVIHGGGWFAGKKEDHRGQARGFAERGYVAVTVNYRLAPKNRWPAQVEDVKCAVRWLRANARRYNVDPECIGAIGTSAGGHLALLLGMTETADGLEGEGGYAEQSSKVRAVINIMGPTDLAEPGWPAHTQKMIDDFLGGPMDRVPGTSMAASPVSYLRKRTPPPVLTVHGTKDPIVPYQQATLLDKALRGAGGTSVLVPIEEKGHALDWSREDWQRIEATIQEFSDRFVRRSDGK